LWILGFTAQEWKQPQAQRVYPSYSHSGLLPLQTFAPQALANLLYQTVSFFAPFPNPFFLRAPICTSSTTPAIFIFHSQDTLSLLLKTADLEDKIKNIHDRLLDSKEQRWNECKAESMARMQDLCDYFGGKTALSRGVKADEKMSKWFGNLGLEIEALDSNDSLLAGRKIQQLQVAQRFLCRKHKP
jgi:hypothetical protein